MGGVTVFNSKSMLFLLPSVASVADETLGRQSRLFVEC